MPSMSVLLPGAGLLALRWWALLSVQVLWRASVGPWWPVVAGGLAIGLAAGGMATGAVPPEAIATDPWLAAGAELALGGLTGLVIALPGHAVVGASQATAARLRAAPGPWRALTVCVVAGSVLTLGLHRPLLLAGQGLAQAWPVGQPQAWVVPAIGLGQLAHGMALLALTLATPALLASAVAELLVHALAREPAAGLAGPGGLAPWLGVAAATIATGASWAAYEAVWASRAVGPDPGVALGLGP